MSKINLFSPIAKVNETEDGGREVWGFATLEVVDKSGEIADFEGTVKAFQKWSDETSERTNGRNLGNIRLMHSPVAVGKTIHWSPTETTIQDEDGNAKAVKGIWVGGYIPPTKQEVIRDIDEGILSAFSIGGSYAKRWWDDQSQAFRFIPELSEYSLVDNPAVPGASITQVIAKADVPWLEKEVTNSHKTPPKGKPQNASNYADPKNFKYPIDAEHIRTAVSYFNQAGQREAGGYSPEEWNKIGHRIASAASQLEGGEYRYENGKVVTPNKKNKGSDKAMTAEELAKAAEQAGLTLDQVQAFFKALTPADVSPAPVHVNTVDGDADEDENKEFPHPNEHASDQASVEADVKDAEEESGVAEKAADDEMNDDDKGGEDETPDDDQPDNGKDEQEEKCDKCGGAHKTADCPMGKAVQAPLAKEGKAINKKNAAHMQHAVNHIDAALKSADYTADDHLVVESQMGQGGTGEEAPAVAEKLFQTAFTKSIGSVVESELAKSLNGFTKAVDDLKTMVKGLASKDELSKAVSELEAVKTLVKEIHETPQAGGPLLNGGNPALFAKNFNQMDVAQVEGQALEKFVKEVKDPVLKDRLGQELAARKMREVFNQ